MMIEYLSIIPTISRCPECMFGFLLAGLRIVTPRITTEFIPVQDPCYEVRIYKYRPAQQNSQSDTLESVFTSPSW